MAIRLIQIPFSHNCVKVRRALELKGVPHVLEDIHPLDRRPAFRASRQLGVPVLVDGDVVKVGSTACALHVEERYPDPPLLPADPGVRAECLLLEDWADRAFMVLSRRVAYWAVLSTGRLGDAFFPRAHGVSRRVKTAVAGRLVAGRFGLRARRYARDLEVARQLAAVAVARIGGRPHLVGETTTLADLALASMTAPFAADAALAREPDMAALLAWGARFLDAPLLGFYRSPGAATG